MGLSGDIDYSAIFWGCPSRVNMMYDSEEDLIVLFPTDNEDIDHQEASIAFTPCHALEIIGFMKEMIEKALEVKEAVKEGALKGLTADEVMDQLEPTIWADVADEIVKRAAKGEAV